jgi:hypothetical protein
MNITEIVKNNIAKFSYYRQGFAYYEVTVNEIKYIFPVSLEDLGTASIFAEMKAITLMRYIRKALEDGSFVKGK